ncbi:uncharacterized protein LOC8073380 isoform X1 [Sorghum bicolor]|nr:uncharacterized protein LOC8073380 isoform X1 [Sorghum bicolor]|eukprot:XP_021318174.1 uncharacterized protein LOC8073380 isoform X1 [Sorghum bicolor]
MLRAFTNFSRFLGLFPQSSEDMARSPRKRKLAAHDVRSASHAVPKNYKKTKRSGRKNELRSTPEEKYWKNATCSICLERPHDAVLLLCSSHNKGCRPYMCGTNYKHSNCLELFKNAYSREKSACEVSTAVELTNQKPKTMLLACPICRGEVKGWTVVKPARRFLNRKRRACMHEDCSFVGTYKRLKKHVKSKHRSSKPREVDPARLAEWEEFENEKERQDAISIVSALNPGSVIMGDYIIDPDSDISDPYSDNSLDDFGDSTSSDSDDQGFYDSDPVRRDRAYRRNGERPSRSLTYVGGLPPRRPLRVGFVHRSLSQRRNS